MMNWLLWKEFRQNQVVVYATLLFLLTPHLLAIYAACEQTYFWHASSRDLMGYFSLSSIYSLLLSQLSIVTAGGNAIAGERADRSAEFLGSLPISRKKVLVSKVLFSLAIIFVIWSIDASALMWLEGRSQIIAANDVANTLCYTAITSLTFFCVAWGLSAFLSSPTVAVLGGLLTPLFLWTGIFFVGYMLGYGSRPDAVELAVYLYCTMCLALSPICFGVGTWYYLRRVEP
jgi:ABC-type transport system involved in multi-copper enzyme maturation permease subunit